MGNSLSEEEEKQILDEAYNLEDPEADRYLNCGTAAPNCQPKHTSAAAASSSSGVDSGGIDGDRTSTIPPPSHHKHRRASSTTSEHAETEERRKRQHTPNNATNGSGGDSAAAAAAAEEEQKKLSYYQMAKLGYQELVNAIIRPPRADYKVRYFVCILLLLLLFWKICIIIFMLNWTGRT
jgi:hypothetical protein